MRTLDVFAILSMASAAFAQTSRVAKVTTENPEGAKYAATFTGGIKGKGLAGSDPFGIGVAFHVDLSGLPEADGPFGKFTAMEQSSMDTKNSLKSLTLIQPSISINCLSPKMETVLELADIWTPMVEAPNPSVIHPLLPPVKWATCPASMARSQRALAR